MVMQGRPIGEGDLALIGDLLAAHPDWNRTRLSRELCARWDWHNAQGRPKDMAARTLLLKLERAGYVRLPARRGPSPNGRRNRQVAPVAPPSEPVRGPLRDLLPLSVGVVAPGSPACRAAALRGAGRDDARVFNGLLAHEHYLGHRNTVGENLRGYLRKVVEKASAALEATYAELLDRLPLEQALNVDETGHKDNGEKFWTWVFRAELKELKREAANMAKRFRENGKAYFEFILAAVRAHFRGEPAPSLLPALG